MSEIKTIRQANDRLAALGQKRRVFSNLKQAQITVEQAEMARKSGPKRTMPLPDDVERGDHSKTLKDKAKAERDPSKKVDLLTELGAKQLAAINAEKDQVKKTDLTREWQQTEKALAYAKLAEKTASPVSARVRKLTDLASE